jgi:protoporphyrinogen/coproporphyrinogen III oxidase
MASVAVIGGGITGLTAAFVLKQRGLRVVLYEAGNRLGGTIMTERRDGYLADLGPNSMTPPEPAAAQILRDLGLDQSTISASPAAAHRYIVRRGKPVRVPGSPAELLTSRLLSNTAKLAVFGEPLVETADSPMDESVAAFVRRRFNQEIVDYLANPFVAGTFAGDPEQLSVRHALPHLQALERTHGSVIKAYVKGMRARRGVAEVASASPKLLSFQNGIGEIPEALERELQGVVRLGSPVTQIRGGGKGWTVGAAFQPPEMYESVIYAAPAHALGEIDLDLAGGDRLSTLSSIVYPPVAVLALGFRREQIAHPLDGLGFLVPEVERRRILGVIFSSSLFGGRAPDGHVLLTAFLGGSRDPDFVNTDPQTLTARVMDELRMLLGVQGDPTFRAHQVWPKAIPQYTLGYGRFKDIIEHTEQANPGLVLAGTYRDGIALGDAIASGTRGADRVVAHLGQERVAQGVSSEPH